MSIRGTLGCRVVMLMAAAGAWAAGSEVADAAMKRDSGAVRAVVQR